MFEDFINVNSWFEGAYREKLDSRYFTFKVALNLFLQRGGKNIVETGCQRLVDDWGGGCSTLIFGQVCKMYDKYLWTIDISEKNLDVAREVTQNCKAKIAYVLADSITFLSTFKESIDLLYLDSLDCPTDPNISPIPAQQHQLTEFQVIEPKLSKNCIVLLDDNNFPNGGKTRLTKEYLSRTGWVCLLDFQQSLWIRK